MTLRTSSPVLLWLPVAAFLAVMIYLSSRPPDELQYPTPDYVAHAAEYAVLGLLLARALNGGMTPRPRTRVLVWTLVACTTWAVADEVHQAFVPGRFSSAADVAADVVGAVGACLLFPFLGRLVARRRARRGSRAGREEGRLRRGLEPGKRDIS
jgi:VanZ family protein